MATTTNYGWTTPDDTALVKDGASAIRTLGSSVDTTTKNLNPETTLGDLVYRSSSANVKTRLGIGSTGNVLTVAGGVPTWAAPAGGGGLTLVAIQTTVKTDTFTTASGSFVDVTGLSVNITPTSASSKILVFFTINGSQEVGSGRASLKLLRDSTVILAGAAAGSRTPALGAFGSPDQSIPSAAISGSFYDSPATTSSLTYKVQIAMAAGSGTAYINRTMQDSDNANQIRMASTITVMEIAA